MGDIFDELAKLREFLSANERIVRISDLDVTDKAVSWLLKCRHELGYWGVMDVAETSLCCIAIACWAEPGVTDEIVGSAEWLLSEACDGQWDTPWDSGVATQALAALGLAQDSRIAPAVAHLRALDPEETARSHGPHHAAQVLNALHAVGADHSEMSRWTRSLLKQLHSRKEIYVLSQTVSAALGSGTATTEQLADSIQELVRYLDEQSTPSEGEMRSFAPAVEALSHVGEPQTTKLVQEKAATLIGSWSDKRAWYKSPRHVAVALIALHGAMSASELVIDRPRFNSAFDSAFRDLPVRWARDNRYSATLGAAIAFLLMLAILVVLYWGHTDALLINGVAVTLLTILMTATGRELARRLRKPTSED